jgi:hypothetical protein
MLVVISELACKSSWQGLLGRSVSVSFKNPSKYNTSYYFVIEFFYYRRMEVSLKEKKVHILEVEGRCNPEEKLDRERRSCWSGAK